MRKEKIFSPHVPPNPPTISHAVRYGNIVTVSGQVGKRVDGSIPSTLEEQVQVAFENLKTILAAAGADLTNVLMCNCYLTDPMYFSAMNEVYHSYFADSEVPPARCTVFAGLANPKLLFEISAIAGV